MDAVHRAKLLLLLADFAGVQSAVPAIVVRYKVIMLIQLQLQAHWVSMQSRSSFAQSMCVCLKWFCCCPTAHCQFLLINL